MNWTGGSRSRVNINNTKNNQENCYEVQQRYRANSPNLSENKNLSQDIIFLNTLMSKPATPLGRQVTRLHLKTPKKKRGWQMSSINLAESPPSKLPKMQMLFSELAPSTWSRNNQEMQLKQTREVKESLKQNLASVETQTEMKLLIDVGIQTEDLHSETNATDEE